MPQRIIAFVLLAAMTACTSAGGSTTVTPQAAAPSVQTPRSGARSYTVKNVGRHLFLVSGRRQARPNVAYPFDVEYHDGKTLRTLVMHSIYVNCDDPKKCWGDPQTFMQHLSASSFVHVLDQYTKSKAGNRYTVGASLSVTDTADLRFNNVLSENAVMGIVHDAILKLKIKNPGYGHIFHVFLPQGVDECITEGPCYSPDNPDSWVFCAYHSHVDYSDLGHVLFTVQPYQYVTGCLAKPPYGAGPLPDSTASTLSHEIFEAISDPDLDAWYNDLTGYEIGDLCEFGPQYRLIMNLAGKKYKIQQEWSNGDHGCAP